MVGYEWKSIRRHRLLKEAITAPVREQYEVQPRRFYPGLQGDRPPQILGPWDQPVAAPGSEGGLEAMNRNLPWRPGGKREYEEGEVLDPRDRHTWGSPSYVSSQLRHHPGIPLPSKTVRSPALTGTQQVDLSDPSTAPFALGGERPRTRADVKHLKRLFTQQQKDLDYYRRSGMKLPPSWGKFAGMDPAELQRRHRGPAHVYDVSGEKIPVGPRGKKAPIFGPRGKFGDWLESLSRFSQGSVNPLNWASVVGNRVGVNAPAFTMQSREQALMRHQASTALALLSRVDNRRIHNRSYQPSPRTDKIISDYLAGHIENPKVMQSVLRSPYARGLVQEHLREKEQAAFERREENKAAKEGRRLQDPYQLRHDEVSDMLHQQGIELSRKGVKRDLIDRWHEYVRLAQQGHTPDGIREVAPHLFAGYEEDTDGDGVNDEEDTDDDDDGVDDEEDSDDDGDGVDDAEEKKEERPVFSERRKAFHAYHDDLAERFPHYVKPSVPKSHAAVDEDEVGRDALEVRLADEHTKLNDPNEWTKAEIKDVLDEMGAPHKTRDTRAQLLDTLNNFVPEKASPKEVKAKSGETGVVDAKKKKKKRVVDLKLLEAGHVLTGTGEKAAKRNTISNFTASVIEHGGEERFTAGGSLKLNSPDHENNLLIPKSHVSTLVDAKGKMDAEVKGIAHKPKDEYLEELLGMAGLTHQKTLGYIQKVQKAGGDFSEFDPLVSWLTNGRYTMADVGTGKGKGGSGAADDLLMSGPEPIDLAWAILKGV